MFISWIRDVKESEFTAVSGVAASLREVVTDSLRQYAQSMVSGQEIIRNFINKYRKNKQKP